MGARRRWQHHHHRHLFWLMWSSFAVKCYSFSQFLRWRLPQFPTDGARLIRSRMTQVFVSWGILYSQTFVIKYTTNRIWMKWMNWMSFMRIKTSITSNNMIYICNCMCLRCGTLSIKLKKSSQTAKYYKLAFIVYAI